MMQLRPYQAEAKTAIFESWEECKKVLLVLPTGCGKTIVFASVIDAAVRDKGLRALVLAHREELLQQAADKLLSATGLHSALEKGADSSIGSDVPVVIGSVQTMCRDNRLHAFAPDQFDVIVVDEAHHAVSDTYRKVLDYFSGAKVLGVTATPDRGDHKTLSEFFDKIAYEYSIFKAVREGYLSRITAKMMSLSIDLKNVKISAGDYEAGDLGEALEPYLDQIANVMAQECKSRKTVVFLPLVSTSKKFCAILQAHGMSAAEVNGESPDRKEILSDFDAGRYSVLCNAMLLTEGWDCPSVDCIVILRPTRSRALYCQMVGRGMRLSPGKKDLLLLDFLWLTGKHSLCRPSALVSPSKEVAEKIDLATQATASAGEGQDLLEMEEQAERDIVADREKSLKETLKEQRGKKTKTVDPLQYAVSIENEELVNYQPIFKWQEAEPTEKQLVALENMGISRDAVKTKGQASAFLDVIIKRKNEGLSTPKQIRCLERRGFRNVGTWTFVQANSLIERIAGNEWRIPYGLNPETYIPE